MTDQKLLKNTIEIDATLETLNVLLKDDETFHHVVDALFRAIDVNNDGSLERSEIKEFIDKICNEMGLHRNPDDQTLEQVFNELDVDGDNDISLDELEVFLRRIFILQRDEILRVVRRK